MVTRKLSEAEVALVRRWVRRSGIWFWLVLPFALIVVVGGIALGLASWHESPLVTAASTMASVGLGLLFVLWRGSIRAYRAVDQTTEVRTLRGVLRFKSVGTRTFTYAIDDLAVLFVDRAIRRVLTVDQPCVVDVIYGAPVLVIAARAGTD